MTTEQAAPSKGPAQILLDMVRSLGLIALIVGVTLLFVPNLIHPGKSSKAPPVNYSDDAVGFRQLTDHPALTPVGLPSSWYPNGATFATTGTSSAHLHIGWVTPDKKYAGLDESNSPAADFITEQLGASGAKVNGHVPIGSAIWDQRTSARGERSLTTTTDGVTIVITGSASAAQQQQLAASLQPATGGITTS